AMVIACWFGLTLSVLAIFVLPSYGRMSVVFPDAWQGVFVHKNNLGWFGTLSLTVFISSWAEKRRSIHFLCGIGVSLFLVVGSGSATSLLAALAIAFVFVFARYRSIRALSYISVAF